ncbi:hypothetical protein E2C01_000901 [Portunus trituberculatus]|uniref:Uncharacterized protein n=1 Tax=Portunus trituberculatus TaxID=210409 RepID=A0A5B7CFJ5_PORTR|nr:hypothetical protein [Portunus trituberculatus]
MWSTSALEAWWCLTSARHRAVHCPGEGRQMNQLTNQPISGPRKAADPVREPTNKRVAPSPLHILVRHIKHRLCWNSLNSPEEASAKLVGNKLTSLHLVSAEGDHDIVGSTFNQQEEAPGFNPWVAPAFLDKSSTLTDRD